MGISKRYQAIMGSLSRFHPEGLKGLRILDVGDYYPTFPVHLADLGALVSVIDFDCPHGTAEIYSRRGIVFYPCNLNDVRDAPIAMEGGYDIIVWLEVIEHLKCSPKYVFREFARLLKPGGILVLGTPNAGRLSSRLRSLMGRHPYIGSLKPFYFGAEEFVGHRREYFMYEIDQMLDWNGYEVLDRIHFNGSNGDHKKQGWLRSTPYLMLTYLLKPLRWLYIVVARNTGKLPNEPDDVRQKRV